MSEWFRPHVHSTEGHRQASWIELFFDLVFIASLAEVIHYVEAHLADGFAHSIGWFFILFTAPWIVWRSSTFYSDRYEENTTRHRLLMIVLMIPIGLFAYSIHYTTDHEYGWFVLSFVLSRFWLLFMWGSVKMTESAQHQTFRVLLMGHGSAMILVTLGWLTHWMIPLVTSALLIELLQTLFTLRSHEKLPALTHNHLPERFGLFMMLVLGEGVLGVIYILSESSQLLLPFLLFLLIVSCFWIYYDQVIYRLFEPTAWHIYWWSVWNLGIVASLLLIRSAFIGLKTENTDSMLLLLIGVLLFLLTTGGSGIVGKKNELSRRMTKHFLQLRFLMGLVLLAGYWMIDSVYLFVSMTLFALLVVLLQGMYYWVRYLKSHSQK